MKRQAGPGRRRRVLVLTADFEPDNWSGIGVAVAAQARALAANGAHVEVLWASAVDERRASERLADGLWLHRQGRDRCAVSPGDFDVVHLHSLALTELALEICRRFARPLVYTCHGLIEDELSPGLEREPWLHAQKILLSCADWVVFLNDRERDDLCRRDAALASRSNVVLNGAELARPSSDVRRRSDLLLFAGRWARSKGMLLLESIAERALDQLDLRLCIAGGHGDALGEAAVERMRRRHAARCQILPWQSRAQLSELYAAATLTLVPSDYEPFGLVALEAQAAGCPVLARRIGGLERIVDARFGSALIDSAEPAHWLAALRDGLAQSRERGGLPGPASRAIARSFSSQGCAQALTAIYARLTPARPAFEVPHPATLGAS